MRLSRLSQSGWLVLILIQIQLILALVKVSNVIRRALDIIEIEYVLIIFIILVFAAAIDLEAAEVIVIFHFLHLLRIALCEVIIERVYQCLWLWL